MKNLLSLLSSYPYQPAMRQSLSRLLEETADWETLANLINDHGIIALAAHNIKEAGLAGQIPKKPMTILENGLMQSIVRNSWLAEKWKEINEILLSNGIEHALLKGMVLEYTLYGAIGLRQMSDNDILIEGKKAMAAWNLLCQNGFKPDKPKSRLHKKIIFNISKHLPALYKDGYAVEIHTEKNLPFITFKENETIFDYCENFSINGTPAYKLKDDVHLEFLKRHFEHHTKTGESQLRLFTDIRLLDPLGKYSFPEAFLMEPIQLKKLSFRKAHYKRALKSMKKGVRIIFIIGDIFPSLQWMKKRYRCGTFGAILKYPMRMGKLLWLI